MRWRDRFLNWLERVAHRRHRQMSDHWRATWMQHERDIAGEWD